MAWRRSFLCTAATALLVAASIRAQPYAASIEVDEANDAVTLKACYAEDLRNIRESSQNPLEIIINHCYLQELPNAIFIRFGDLQSLEISDSRVNNLQDFALNGLRNLEVLNLSRNNLTTVKSWSDHSLENLQTLDLRRNLISKLDGNSFKRYPSLLKLVLAINSIRVIPEGTFQQVSNLRYLNVGKNLLTTIEESTLKGLSKLMHVSFHNNQITSIHQFAFISNSHLKSVQLQGNKLTEFDADLFSNLPRLAFLNCSGNELKTVPDLSFKSNGDLRILDMSYNRIVNLMEDSFKGLFELEVFNVSHNQLQTLNKYVLKDFNNLRDLDISHNELDYVGLKLFSTVVRLERLNLSANAINDIEQDVFHDLPKLASLDLSYNKLTKDAFLWPVLNLNVLNMSHNVFSSINTSLFESLDLVELAGNPWDCRFLVRELMHRSRHVNYGKNYVVEKSDNILTANGIECIDERGKLRDIVVLDNSATSSYNYSEYHRFHFFHDGHVDSRPIRDNFDTKSTVIWLMSGALVVFGAFKLIQLLLRHSEHQSEKWRLAKHVSNCEHEEDVVYNASPALSGPGGFHFSLAVPHATYERQYTPTIK